MFIELVEEVEVNTTSRTMVDMGEDLGRFKMMITSIKIIITRKHRRCKTKELMSITRDLLELVVEIIKT